jgi:hypothetical protein
MYRAPYSVVKCGEKWTIRVCGADVICCERRVVAVRTANCARALLTECDTENIRDDGTPSARATKVHKRRVSSAGSGTTVTGEKAGVASTGQTRQ